MSRLFIVACAVFGAYVLIGTTFKNSYHVAFHLGEFGFSYLLLACIATGFLAYKVTK